MDDSLRDIQPPVNIPWNPVPWIIGILAGIAIAAILFLLIRRWFRKRRRVKPLTADERALQRLNTLLAENRETADNFKRFYFELSAILRTYVHDRFDIPADDMTSEELTDRLKQSGRIPPTDHPWLIDFIRTSDRVRYTDSERVDHPQALTDAEAIRSFIIRTIPATEPTVSTRRRPS